MFIGALIMVGLAGVEAWRDHGGRWGQLGIRKRQR